MAKVDFKHYTKEAHKYDKDSAFKQGRMKKQYIDARLMKAR